ncbi:hypothetical protein TNCV_3201671 [Trichonephila clavipes]|nr:hypothetical protein TNCV_3201671 [Trichonephila clavipes]
MECLPMLTSLCIASVFPDVSSRELKVLEKAGEADPLQVFCEVLKIVVPNQLNHSHLCAGASKAAVNARHYIFIIVASRKVANMIQEIDSKKSEVERRLVEAVETGHRSVMRIDCSDGENRT